jgi:VIT1/CCC1 family predicted Fe2+/Mn2+ transporter
LRAGLIGSVLLTLIALFVFGVIKGRFTTNRPVRSGWQTVLVGGVAAAPAFVIVRMFE